MQIARLPGASLHWREDGDPGGPPIVFANSLGTDLRLWDKIVPQLPAGLRCIRFDKRGHGLSDHVPGPYTMAELTGDAAALLDHLGVSDCVFVGLSIGGMIAQGLAASRPDLVRGLVLSNTAARMGDADMWQARIAAIEQGGIAAMANPILERWFTPEFRRGDEFIAWRNMLLSCPVAGYLGCCHAIADADMTATTSGLRLPTLAIAGAADGSSPPDLVAATARLIPGATFHVIDRAGHLPCVEQPDRYAQLLSGFLRELGHV